MIDIPTLIVTPASVSDAYHRNATGSASGSTTSFSESLDSALRGAVDAGHAADTQATKAITGEGNLTEVVTAVSKAELTLQTVTTIRDKVVQAYQDIMKMPI